MNVVAGSMGSVPASVRADVRELMGFAGKVYVVRATGAGADWIVSPWSDAVEDGELVAVVRSAEV